MPLLRRACVPQSHGDRSFFASAAQQPLLLSERRLSRPPGSSSAPGCTPRLPSASACIILLGEQFIDDPEGRIATAVG
jgi:hypothetical protein